MPLVSAFAALPAPVIETSTGFPDLDVQEKKHQKTPSSKVWKVQSKHLYNCRDIRVTPSIWCTKMFVGFPNLDLQGIILSLDPPTPRAPSHDLLHPLNVPWHCCHDVSMPDWADHVP